jgi:hypothetical protein
MLQNQEFLMTDEYGRLFDLLVEQLCRIFNELTGKTMVIFSQGSLFVQTPIKGGILMSPLSRDRPFC